MADQSVTLEEIRRVCGGDYALADQVLALLDRQREEIAAEVEDMVQRVIAYAKERGRPEGWGALLKQLMPMVAGFIRLGGGSPDAE